MTTPEKTDHREERLLDQSTQLEHAHLTSRQERIVEIYKELEMQHWMLHRDD